MLIGHYGISMGAKALRHQVPLWVFVGAAQLLDVVWCLLITAGVERVDASPTRPEGLTFSFYPYSHSLVAALGWPILAGVLVQARWKTPKGAWLVGIVVTSHWALDLLVHHRDLPLWPGNSPMFGLGLWDLGKWEPILEITLLVAGGVAWSLAARRRIGPVLFMLSAVALLLASIVTKSPVAHVDTTSLGLMGLSIYVGFVLLAYWLDRQKRQPQSNQH